MTLPDTADLDRLADFSTPTICNAIEALNIRLRNEGYMDGSIINRLHRPQPMVGYAVTVKMRTGKPPVKGLSYPDRSDWWDIIQAAPSPRIIVIQDTDTQPGSGSVCGGIHATIFKALGCTGIVTNGAVRDIEALSALHLHVYSGSIVPSHAYAHIVDIGMSVEIGNMTIENGELLHGDCNGIAKIPVQRVKDVQAQALAIMSREQEIMRYCAGGEFSVEGLRGRVERWLEGEREGSL